MVETGGGKNVPSVDSDGGAANDLNDRVARLENEIDSKKLTDEARTRQQHVDASHESALEDAKQQRDCREKDSDQRRDIRRKAVRLAVCVICFMGFLVVADVVMAICGISAQVDGSVRIALFVSPIVAISTITIVLLVGAFRGFKDKDMKNFPITTIASEAGRAIKGQ